MKEMMISLATVYPPQENAPNAVFGSAIAPEGRFQLLPVGAAPY